MLTAIKKRLIQGIMRSFTIFQATDMDRLLWLSLLLTYLPVIVSTQKDESCLSQPKTTIWKKIGQEAVLNCIIISNCSTNNLNFEWFSFKKHVHLRLDLTKKSKYDQVGGSLKIKSLDANDSGIYHCAAASPAGCCTQHVGQGATLVVTEYGEIMVRHILLWLSFFLLAIYSLAIVTLILVKKYGCNMSTFRKMSKNDKNNSTKKIQFRDVLQEMYSKRNIEKSKQTTSRSCSQDEAAGSEVNCSSDDVYQNV